MGEAGDRAKSARALVEKINRAWLEKRPEDLSAFFHPSVAMALPGFVVYSEGAASMVRGFEEFTESCTVESHSFTDWHVHAADDTAVVSFHFEMVYERDGKRFRSTGRDLWVVSLSGPSPKAVWRTLIDLTDSPVEP